MAARNASSDPQNTRGMKRVALLLESSMAFDRGIARGIGEYIRSHSGWIILIDPMLQVTTKDLRHWAPDGIITSIHLPNIEEISGIRDIPMVGFGSYSEELDGHHKFPIVTSDQQAIGRMAAQHFMNNGLKRFAFCGGDEQALWCRQRQAGFTEELSRHHHHCETYQLDAAVTMPEAIHSLGQWLDSLPKPCGVFVFFDGWARRVLDSCKIRNIHVPQEVSVLGVDNDRWLCELSQPMLSSIDVNVRNAGYTAANLINQLMSGKSVAEKLNYIQPSEVITRDSSNFMDFEAPEVAFAIRYIKEHACDPITTADVLKVTGMSSSTAYRKFLKAIGRSIHSEIQGTQLARVKKLLTTTNMSVTEAAKAAGFHNVRYLTQIFREDAGLTPTEYRRKHSTPAV